MSAAPPKVALVTGGGSGIGRASALALADAGWAVAVTGRRQEALDETLDLAKPGQAMLAQAVDITRPEAVAALFAAVVARFGRLDLLFNNAGRSAPAVAFEDLDVETWRAVVDVNLTAAFLCAQGAVRQFKAQAPQGGRIINNGSISAHVPRPNSAAYTATKHAITGLTRSLALDGRAFDITCGQIDIGNAATPMTRKMAKGVMQANGQIAAEPTMDVAHAAQTVVFMAGLPPQANIPFVTVMASQMPYIGRG
jgi:NAD(P)-dependent dehydrogenase (short-subunit alcohol dehydrogenase family)